MDSEQHRIVFCAAGQRFLGSGSMRMEVVNLARNFVITGDDFTDESCTTVGGGGTRCTVGLHTIAIGDQSGVTGPTLQMKHTRVEKCGQRGILAKCEASVPFSIYFSIVSFAFCRAPTPLFSPARTHARLHKGDAKDAHAFCLVHDRVLIAGTNEYATATHPCRCCIQVLYPPPLRQSVPGLSYQRERC